MDKLNKEIIKALEIINQTLEKHDKEIEEIKKQMQEKSVKKTRKVKENGDSNDK